MLVLAEELGKFTDYIGGPDYIPILLPPLENMAMQEESIVREKVRAAHAVPPALGTAAVSPTSPAPPRSPATCGRPGGRVALQALQPDAGRPRPA